MSRREEFTVEPYLRPVPGIGQWEIRYNPIPRAAPPGTKIMGWSFTALVASEWLANQQETLQEVAHILNNRGAIVEAIDILQGIVAGQEVPDPDYPTSTIVESLPPDQIDFLVKKALNLLRQSLPSF